MSKVSQPETATGGACLFIINGLGMGNSTRCHAIMEYLIDRGVRVHVLTSGNGLTYFGDRPGLASVTGMEAFFYSGKKGGVSGWQTLASLPKLVGLAKAKERQLAKLLTTTPVDVVVTDSEYSTAPARRLGIPIIGLNNSDVVVSEYFARTGKPTGIRSQFWFIEFSDYLFHKYRTSMVISPAAAPGTPRHARIRRVGLIVRQKVRAMLPAERTPFPPPRTMKSVVFMLSGSIFASAIPFAGKPLPFHIDIVGRSGDPLTNVTFHGRLMDNTAFLQKADALVINGGFSAVSEAIALNKPTFVIPVPGHAEQYINARVLHDLGCGYIAREDTILDQLRALYDANRWDGLQPRQPITGTDGASEAADVICELIYQRRAAPK